MMSSGKITAAAFNNPDERFEITCHSLPILWEAQTTFLFMKTGRNFFAILIFFLLGNFA